LGRRPRRRNRSEGWVRKATLLSKRHPRKRDERQALHDSRRETRGEKGERRHTKLSRGACFSTCLCTLTCPTAHRQRRHLKYRLCGQTALHGSLVSLTAECRALSDVSYTFHSSCSRNLSVFLRDIKTVHTMISNPSCSIETSGRSLT
jgi:hypothetical protein